jgi:NAD(P)-dependent dehydrogenase (short-subunit alcohol dehydrogenase family)
LDANGKVALITGGARIGQKVADVLAERRCSLALVYRSSRDAADASVESARSKGVKAVAVRADATDKDQVAAAIETTINSLGRLDILINMAAAYLATPNPGEADWTQALDANARSVFLFSTLAAPFLKRSGAGRVVNFADWLPASRRPHYRGYTPYYVSKAAVLALTESLALELAPEVLVNAVAPGPILAPPNLSTEENAEAMEATPLRRWGGAEEIAKTVTFLIETDFITGECIRVDGGRHLY